MRRTMRLQRFCLALSTGGITLGILQGFALIDWATFWASWLSNFFATIVTLLFGGSLGTLGNATGAF
jgi:hypothetical protein